jgi:RNA polymerase sigma factor (sigma-70 family)
MPKYKSADIGQLGHQLTLSPRRLRLSQIAGAERLLELIEPDRSYPYDFVCFHLTGYQPLQPSGKSELAGKDLIADVVRLIEHLSQNAAIPLSVVSEAFQTQEELSKRLSVSTKTIARWRQRGLSGLRVLDSERTSRLVFTERALLRFVSRNRQLVLRGGAFRQLSIAERDGIIERARELVASQRIKLQEAARCIADESGRAIETIRYTLRRFDRDSTNPLFDSDGTPSVPPSYHEVYKAFLAGLPISAIEAQCKQSRRQVYRICLEMKAYELLNRNIAYVYNAEFDGPEAKDRILDIPEPRVESAKTVKPPSSAKAYLRSLYDVPLLTQPQEQDLFRRYNFCKHRASKMIAALEPCSVTKRQLNRISACLADADTLQQRLIKANLRLVVNIANRHLRSNNQLFELVSDGNMSLLRAVERFDYARGFKFSTYASWAIMKNFARTVPETQYHYTRYVTGREEVLDSAPDAASAPVEQSSEAAGLRTAIARGLDQLGPREREILAHHYGLASGSEPTTLEQLGQRFGVTKERIRQIEKRALDKLRTLLSPGLAEYSRD